MVSSHMKDNYANAARLPARATKVDIVAAAPRRTEVLRTRELLKLLSKQKLPASDADFAQGLQLRTQSQAFDLEIPRSQCRSARIGRIHQAA